MKIRKHITCPLEVTHDVIKGKWKPILLWTLKNGPMSLSSLETSINGITQKMLMEQLKELKDSGLISKTTFAGYPLKVEYLLTNRGTRLLDAILIMQRIGIEIMESE